MKTHIRPATREDFPTLLALDRACFPEGIAYSAEELRHYLSQPGSVSLILEFGGEIAGFLVLEIPAAGAATVITLDVRESFRRRGIGSELLAEAERILKSRNVPACVLQVSTINDAAIELYKRSGFQKARRIPNYYADGSDAYMMVKLY